MLSCVRLFATPWTIARQAPLSMGFPRQEYWSGLLFAPPGDLPDPGTESASALTGGFFTTEPLGRPHSKIIYHIIYNTHTLTHKYSQSKL